VRLLLIGAPGAGKGTQATRIAEHFHVAHISSGDLLREHVTNGTEIGRKAQAYMEQGDLVPDELVLTMLRKPVTEAVAGGGYVLDGFPRTVEQARALDAELEAHGRQLTAALFIDVPDQEVVRRISGRRQCVKNEQHVYHVEFDPPKHEGVCDQDGARLIQRDDDKPETVKHRLAVYHEKTEPVIGYYEERSILRRFDGSRSPTEVHDHIRATLATLRLEEDL
jgi:adenylate kinase